MNWTRAEALELSRRIRARTAQFLDSLGDLERLIEEDVAASAPAERNYVREVGKETLAIARKLRNELKVHDISEARGKRRRKS